MNYTKIYNNIINNRIKYPYIGYTEKHHILPKSLGGSDNKDNLVALTAKEHFICHLLLTKIYNYNTFEGKKMVKAFMSMVCWHNADTQERYITSKIFSILREQFAKIQSESQTGTGNSQFGSCWIHNDVTREFKKIKKSDLLPDGWEYGRSFDLDLKQQEVENRKKIKKLINLEKKNKSKVEANNYYEIFKIVGFDEFVKLTGYNKSYPNLIQSFERHVVESYKPQMGKKRSKQFIPE